MAFRAVKCYGSNEEQHQVWTARNWSTWLLTDLQAWNQNQISFICVFYNPPKVSRYRYVEEYFEKLIAAVPKTKTALICGVLNFPNTNWGKFSSADWVKYSVLDLYENAHYPQGVEFHTWAMNTLDVALFRNCSLFASLDGVFMHTYGCSDHKAVKLSLECPNCENRSIIENSRSYGSADFSALNELLQRIGFIPKCYTDIN